MKRLHVALALVAAIWPRRQAPPTWRPQPNPQAHAPARSSPRRSSPSAYERRRQLRLFDLRPAAAYQQFHIPTARRVEPADLSAGSLSADADVVLYRDSRAALSDAVRVLRTRRQAKVLVLREGVSEWLGRVHEPRLAVDATPEERAQFDRAAAMSRFFGGVPLAGVPRSEVPVGVLDGRAPHRRATGSSGAAVGGPDPEARVLTAPGSTWRPCAAASFRGWTPPGAPTWTTPGRHSIPSPWSSATRSRGASWATRTRKAGRRCRPDRGRGGAPACPTLLRRGPARVRRGFTVNASGGSGFRRVLPFRPGSRLVLTADNHNSVNGIREFARRAGAEVDYVPLGDDLRGRDRACAAATTAPSLFAFPAQSNFSGLKHPLRWIQARAAATPCCSTPPPLLPQSPVTGAAADFVALSFYKMFGYPTGVGALLVRRDAMALLDRNYFAGGTVQIVSVQNRRGTPAGRELRLRGRHSQLPGHACGVRWPEVVRSRSECRACPRARTNA